MKKLITIIAVLLWAGGSWGQTTLISPSGDGGFENGATLEANGWTVSNSANNPWVLGTYVSTPPFSNQSAYVSNDGGVTNNYTNTLIALNYLYRDVVVPSGQTAIILSFNWVCNGESTWDMIQVFVGPTSIVPVGTTTYPGSGLSNVPAGITGATFVGSVNLQTTIQSVTYYIPASFAGTTMRLIFAWKDDGSGGSNPGGSIDNISLTSQTPVPMTGVYTIDPAGSGSSNFTTFAAAVNTLNLNGVGSGGVTFNVADGATFNELPLNIAATGTAANPIVFQQSGSGTRPIVNVTGTSGTADFAFKLNSCDYITFKGLDIRDAGTTSSNYTEYGFYFLGTGSDGCQNNTVRSCVIDLNKANTSSRGVYLSSVATVAGGANSGNKFYNNTIQDAYNGYYFLGTSTISDDNNEVNTQSGGTSLINNLGNNLSTTLYGIYIAYQTNLTIANTTLSNITGSSGIYGIYETSGSTNTVNYFNNEIVGITGTSTSSTVYGFYVGVGTTHNIYSNLIHGITHTYTVYGLYIGSGTTNNIYKNAIYDINYSGVSTLVAYGLSLAGGTTNNVYNNFIYDIRAAAGTTGNPSVRALNVSGGTTDNIFYNTVYLNYTSSSATNQSAALYMTTTPTTVDLRNNIFINKTNVTTGAYAVAFYRSSTTLTNLSANTNNNLYYAGTPGPKNLISYDLTNADQTLIAYKARVAPRDINSITEDPPFVSNTAPYNLHLQNVATQCESGGSPVNAPIVVNTDYDGQARNASTPDIGADEFNGIFLDLTPPTITYTPFLNISTTGARTLTATITDYVGVPTSGIGLPRLYWKINAGAYTGVTGTWVSGGTYTFTFGAGVVLGDVVSYYVVAQDIASTPNVIANPAAGASGYTYSPPACSTPPTTPYTYTIVGVLSGTYAVGAGQTYPTITAAIADLNFKEVVAPVTFELWDATYPSETFPLLITQYAGMNASRPVTFKPKAGVTATVSGSSTTGIFVVFGADYITINGSNSGGTDRNLTFENTNNAANTYVLGIFNNGTKGAQNTTIKNCVVKAGGKVNNTWGIILNALGGDFDNTTIQNNQVLNAMVGMQFVGVATGITNNGLITQNIFGSTDDALTLGNIGMNISNIDGLVISNNTIQNLKTGSNPKGINLGVNSLNTLIDGNIITGIVYTGTSGYGGKGIDINTGSGSSNLVISNNALSQMRGDGWNSFATDAIVGIRILGTTGGIKIYHNSVNLTGTLSRSGATTDASAALYAVGTATNLDVRDNIFLNSLENTTGVATAYSVYSDAPASAFTNINYNDYWVSGPEGVLGYFGAQRTTLAAWQGATGQDANSKNIDPVFVSATDLHASAAELNNQGQYLSTVAFDLTGTTRSNPPDIGAYEFGTNPAVNTMASTGIDCSGGTLHGTINANTLSVDAYFDYGPTTAYGNSMAATPSTVTGTTTTDISAFLALPPSTTYHFRARGVYSGGVEMYGQDMVITTSATGAPVAATQFATNILADGATLNGTVNALCFSTTVTFEYGETAAYGFTVSADQSPLNSGSLTDVTATLTGLGVNTLYHFRVVAESSNGTTYGEDFTFTTGANPPTVNTNSASNIGNFTARLNGTVIANNQNSTVTFEYGLTTSYGSTVAGVPGTVNGSIPASVYADISGLVYNTTYHFRCVGQNNAGTSYGNDMTFTTLCPTPDPAGAITGPTSVCQATNGHVYTVPAITYAYNGYVWTVPTGGTIVGGNGTNSITVNYSSSAVSGNVTVYGTSVCGNGTPSSLAVTINPLPVPTINGPAIACITSTYTYSTQAGMNGYVWTVSAGGQIMSGAGTNTVTIKWNNSGAQMVSVTYNSAAGCPAAAPGVLNVTVGTLPSPTIAGADIVCVNGGLQVYTTQTGYFNYVWTISQGGTIVTGQGTYQVEVDWLQAGDRSVSVNYETSSGCDAANPATFAVEVWGLPGNAGPVEGPADVCAGDSYVSFDTPPIPNADDYIWTLPAGATIVEGENTRHIKVDFALDAESGEISVHGESVCGAGQASPPFNVHVVPALEAPVASVDEFFMLHSSSPSGNQWYLDGTAIEGATGQDYQAEVEGTYWTIVTINGCSSPESNHVDVIFTGLGENEGTSFSLYPVPNNGKFTATMVINGQDNFTISVYNELGSKIFEKTDIHVDGKAQQTIDLNNPGKGVYTVIFKGNDQTVIRKVLVTR